MAEYSSYHLAALAAGIGAATISSTFAPQLGWEVLAVITLSGYIGGLLPDIDNTHSSGFRVVRWFSGLAAFIVPVIQFIYRPTDLLLAIPVAVFMVSRFWELLHQIMKRGGHTHSVLAAVCLSLGVAWVAYLTAGDAAALPAFLASSASYVLHLLLDDLDNVRFVDSPTGTRSSLVPIGRGRVAEFYGILAIGFVSFFALWGI
ncbi:metal-dependent hydrolase [Thiothrix nivea]|uniref:Membrane-bound metal-dependent hydrolase n=1 Tax=Thiothrix nivea (strain ATCC 35100 / DSM 5205 / JP2) TaxID=870187 RepID=A0A656HGA9_THINJ|nr:metal-dependent hydrolase [Thiothrix nivea]EIJ35938.1 hypothetical protein Thini_3426 [Thiothrix nivea DSM 5205]